jgi:hypothetical protein
MQSKRHTAFETLTNTTIGFFGSLWISYMVVHSSMTNDEKTFWVTLLCTVWSIWRGYTLRRIFNKLATTPPREIRYRLVHRNPLMLDIAEEISLVRYLYWHGVCYSRTFLITESVPAWAALERYNTGESDWSSHVYARFLGVVKQGKHEYRTGDRLWTGYI